METVLEVKNLSVSFDTQKGEVEAVRDVSFSVKKGEILAIVGESGCGKTVMSQSVLKLLPRNSRIKSGQILVEGTDIMNYKEKEMQRLRGTTLSMVFQDPMMNLNPTIPVGVQITEAILRHEKVSREEAKQRAIEMLQLVGIEDAAQRYRLQPHYFSGGMRQRCVLAIALALKPKLLFADEPTTALDVTVQSKILNLLLDLKEELGLSIIFITHDLSVAAKIADRVAVMYAGKIVEIGKAEEVFYNPQHPYTWGLLSSLPSLAKKGEQLKCITGMPPSLLHPPTGDAFARRNPYAMEIDYKEMPPMFEITPTHYAATWLLDKRAPKIARPQILKHYQGERVIVNG